MTYIVEFTSRAARDLESLQPSDQRRIAKKIDALAATPRPAGCKKLAASEDYFRIRIGSFRVIYSIEDRRLAVLVIRIGDRRDIYR